MNNNRWACSLASMTLDSSSASCSLRKGWSIGEERQFNASYDLREVVVWLGDTPLLPWGTHDRNRWCCFLFACLLVLVELPSPFWLLLPLLSGDGNLGFKPSCRKDHNGGVPCDRRYSVPRWRFRSREATDHNLMGSSDLHTTSNGRRRRRRKGKVRSNSRTATGIWLLSQATRNSVPMLRFCFYSMRSFLKIIAL